MQVHHLSHIDLDGYGAQLVAKETFNDIRFYNANYGKEVEVRLQNILDNIKKDSNSDFLILITDLNLNLNEAKFIQDEINMLNMSNKNIKLKLLDHHISGTFNVLQKEYGIDSEKSAWLEPFVEMINSADTWKEDGFAFDFGKVALGMIAQSREFTRFMFDDYDRIFKFNMLYEAKKYLLDSNNKLRDNANVNLDNNIFLFKKSILGGDVDVQTMEEILSIKQVELLSQDKEQCSIFYKNKRGLLTYAIGGISILANLFLKENSEFDFFMDIGVRGNVSIRANGNCDVSMMSKELFGGGGHKNASGGKFDGFKETFLYDEAKEQVVNLISSKEDLNG